MVATSPALGLESFTRREREVLLAVARGLTNKAIGRELFIDPITVKNHLMSIYARVPECRRGNPRVGVVLWLARRGLLPAQE